MFEAIPQQREQRWQLMETIIEDWLRPLKPEDGVSEAQLCDAEQRLGFQLPLALREFYRRFGNAADIWSWQDQLIIPGKLGTQGETLEFYRENQGVWNMEIALADIHLPDPPVSGWRADTVEEQEIYGSVNGSLSECVIQLLAYNMKWAIQNKSFCCYLDIRGNDYPEWGYYSPETLQMIEQQYVRCAFPVWHLWSWPTIFYEGPDTLIEVHISDDNLLYFTPRTGEALTRFERLAFATRFCWDSSRQPSFLSMQD